MSARQSHLFFEICPDARISSCVGVIDAYGAGVNSTAMIVGQIERGEQLDLILFADTGGEKPETYEFLWHFAGWVYARRPRCEFSIVRNDGMYQGLENNCLRTGTLPSKAYGLSSCSDKYKKRPQDKFVKAWKQARGLTGKLTKCIGIDADEAHRAKYTEDRDLLYRYPLLDWDWGREECVAAIQKAGLPIPPKSACFFCPSSKKAEVLWLARAHPDLFARAVQIEEQSRDSWQSVKGLGRHWSWHDLVKADERKRALYAEARDQSCLCFDGE